MDPKIIDRQGKIWGLGIYLNTVQYYYLAIQVGPFWIYLIHQRWFEKKTLGGRDDDPIE